jgi:betaine-aldehyde dehydrogenase
VVESIAREFTDRLLEYVKKVRVGDPMKPDTDVGPLISAEAAEEIEGQVAQSVKEGARLLLGGKRYQPQGLKGHFFEPTILVDVRQGSFSTREEIFGPVFSLIVAKDGDDAIRMANDSEFGLGATIFTKSLENTVKAIDNIRAGSFWVNDPLATNDAAPFGGMRASGIGRELGIEGLDAFREPKHVHIESVMERKDYWFPERD